MGIYRELFRVPRVPTITAAQLFARLPLGMLSLAILVHVEHRTGSYATAGVVVACLTIGEAVAMPLTSRLAGRGERTATTLAVCAAVNGASMLGLAAATFSGPPLMALGLLVGASVPPLMPVVRALYPQMLPRDGVRALFALDTTAQEMIWVIGPVAAMSLSTLVSTAMPLIASAVIGVVVAFTADFLAVRLTSARTVSVLLSFDPVLAAVLGALVLGERIDTITLLGIVLVAAAGGCTTWAVGREASERRTWTDRRAGRRRRRSVPRPGSREPETGLGASTRQAPLPTSAADRPRTAAAR